MRKTQKNIASQPAEFRRSKAYTNKLLASNLLCYIFKRWSPHSFLSAYYYRCKMYIIYAIKFLHNFNKLSTTRALFSHRHSFYMSRIYETLRIFTNKSFETSAAREQICLLWKYVPPRFIFKFAKICIHLNLEYSLYGTDRSFFCVAHRTNKFYAIIIKVADWKKMSVNRWLDATSTFHNLAKNKILFLHPQFRYVR